MSKQFITDSEGRKVSVILPMEEYIELMEDLEDLAAVAELRNEPTVPWEQVKKELIDNGLL
ncbi:MAG: hypothetical protein ACU84H_02050 [Gammaproteobacteria bacterium]